MAFLCSANLEGEMMPNGEFFIRYPETSRWTGLKKHFIPVIQHFLFMSLIGRSTDLSGRHARPTRLLSLAGVLSFSKAMSLLMPNGFL